MVGKKTLPVRMPCMASRCAAVKPVGYMLSTQVVYIAS